VNLALDFGNTRIKAGLFAGSTLVDSWVLSYEDWDRLAEGAFPLGWSEAKYSGILSVGKWPLEKIVTELLKAFPHCKPLPLTAGTATPLRNRYGTPETLGMDRLALANGAWQLGGGKPLIAFSAGTALTWEVVNAEGEYLGGGIAPGMRMRFASLHEGTAKLPLVSPEGPFALAGSSTEESIRGGVVLGMAVEIDGLADRARREWGPLTQVFLTGGDAPILVNHLQNVNFADSGLVLLGINAIVQHHSSDA
jgi:type III pantothenate kinase